MANHSQQLPQLTTPPWQPLQPSSPQPSRPPAVSLAILSSHGGMNQHRAVTSSGHSVRGSLRAGSHERPSKSQDAERDQQESHTTITMFVQIEKSFHCTQGGGASSDRKRRSRRGQSPLRRGARENALAVRIHPISTYATHFCSDCI